MISLSINGVNYKIDVAPDARLWLLRNPGSALLINTEPDIDCEVQDSGEFAASDFPAEIAGNPNARAIATHWGQTSFSGGKFDLAQLSACDAAAEVLEWDLEPAGNVVVNATLPPPVTRAVVRIFSEDGNLGLSASFFPTAGQVN